MQNNRSLVKLKTLYFKNLKPLKTLKTTFLYQDVPMLQTQKQIAKEMDRALLLHLVKSLCGFEICGLSLKSIVTLIYVTNWPVLPENQITAPKLFQLNQVLAHTVPFLPLEQWLLWAASREVANGQAKEKAAAGVLNSAIHPCPCAFLLPYLFGFKAKISAEISRLPCCTCPDHPFDNLLVPTNKPLCTLTALLSGGTPKANQEITVK